MEPIKKHDLVDALVSASIPSIEKFFEEETKTGQPYLFDVSHSL
ncbi:hypothetical protein [Shewanella algae]|nr:hypothetical protein [Shewanella algae]